MTTTLKWPRRSRFVDRDADVDVTGPDATAEVPDDAVDRYLSRGWEHVEAAEEPADDTDEPADDQDTGTSSDTEDSTDGADDDADAEDADATDDSSAEEEADAFDAAEFVNGHWNAVASAITDGEADGHLQAVEEAERARGDDDDMRDSVATALEDRRAETEA